jgi:uncharacterized protein YqgQ
MKIYDKEMYQKEQWIKSALLVIGVFVLGFIVGYFVYHFEKQDEIEMLQNQVNTLQYELNQAEIR